MSGPIATNQPATSKADVPTFHYPPPWDGVVWAPRPAPRVWVTFGRALKRGVIVAGGALVAGCLINVLLTVFVAVAVGAV